jgi:CBS domain-containing protein
MQQQSSGKVEPSMLRDIIRGELVTVEPDMNVTAAARTMAERGVGAVMILNQGRPRGILTDRDIVVRCLARHVDVDDCTVEQVMTESLESAKDTDGIFDCIQKMHRARVRRIPVVDGSGQAVGLVSFGDLLTILGRELNELTEGTTPPLDEELKSAA